MSGCWVLSLPLSGAFFLLFPSTLLSPHPAFLFNPLCPLDMYYYRISLYYEMQINLAAPLLRRLWSKNGLKSNLKYFPRGACPQPPPCVCYIQTCLYPFMPPILKHRFQILDSPLRLTSLKNYEWFSTCWRNTCVRFPNCYCVVICSLHFRNVFIMLCLEYIKATPKSLLHSLRSKFCCSKMIYHRGWAWGSMHLEIQFVTWSWSLVQTCVAVVASLTWEMVAYHAYGTADSGKSCCYSWFVCHDKTAAPMSIFMHSPYLKWTQLLYVIWWYCLWAASLCLSWFAVNERSIVSINFHKRALARVQIWNVHIRS